MIPAITILDVSSHQGPGIDWPRVAASGLVRGAYVKLTEGAYPPGNIDEQGPRNLAGARAAGLPAGAYHFLSPLSDPELQAKLFLVQLQNAGGADLPPMLDLETNAGGKLAPAAWALAWLAVVEEALGVTPLVYTAGWVSALDHLAGCPELTRFPAWVAAYGQRAAPPPCAPWAAWGEPGGPLGWQYTGSGSVPGVPPPCDLSRFWAMPGAAPTQPNEAPASTESATPRTGES